MKVSTATTVPGTGRQVTINMENPSTVTLGELESLAVARARSQHSEETEERRTPAHRASCTTLGGTSVDAKELKNMANDLDADLIRGA